MSTIVFQRSICDLQGVNCWDIIITKFHMSVWIVVLISVLVLYFLVKVFYKIAR